MGNLLAIDLGSIWVGSLKSFPNDWVELGYDTITGFRNIFM